MPRDWIPPNAKRWSMRLQPVDSMNLGPLLDYRPHIDTEPAISVLLPERPVDNLIALLRENGVGCVYEGPTKFEVAIEPELAA